MRPDTLTHALRRTSTLAALVALAACSTKSPVSAPDAGDPRNLPVCPSRYGVTEPTDFYPYGAQPEGLACSVGASCQIGIHDCPGDWPFGDQGLINGYTCTCASGTWSCAITAQGLSLCSNYPSPCGPCPAGFACAYAIADGCAAKPSCQPVGAPHDCATSNYCACNGGAARSCTFSGPYANAPVSEPYDGSACPVLVGVDGGAGSADAASE